jgi:hypothetical protein
MNDEWSFTSVSQLWLAHKLNCILFSTGDWCHIAIIVKSLIFVYAAVFRNDSKIFDPVWRPDGFCVSNKDVPYWNSHDLCLYFDTLACIVVAILYWALKDGPGMDAANELVKFNIPGILFHGILHGTLAKASRDGITPDPEIPQFGYEVLSKLSVSEIVYRMLPSVVFWLFLLKCTMPKASLHVVIPMTAVSMFFEFYTPRKFGFTYVQTVLLMVFSLNQLTRPSKEKDFVYGLYPLLVGPIGVVGWIESTLCSKGVIDIGGHCTYTQTFILFKAAKLIFFLLSIVIYDAFIPISITVFYLTCWATARQEKAKIA